MTRTHDKESFFKYMTSETALKVLSSKRLRYSQAHLFNDPFDNQINTNIPFDFEDLGEKVNEEFCQIVRNREFSKLDLSQRAGMITHLLLKELPEENVEEALKELCKSTDEIVRNLPKFKHKFDVTTRQIIDGGAILCVSELKNNILMWSHYANMHRGVVLELACIEEIDNTLLAAEPIKYSHDFPVLAELIDFVKLITGQTSELVSAKRVRDELIYTKSIDWEYEKEWRVWIAYNQGEINDYIDLLEHPKVFKAIYLGCNISEDNQNKLVELIGEDPELMHMEIYKASKSKIKFELEFNKMTL